MENREGIRAFSKVVSWRKTANHGSPGRHQETHGDTWMPCMPLDASKDMLMHGETNLFFVMLIKSPNHKLPQHLPTASSLSMDMTHMLLSSLLSTVMRPTSNHIVCLLIVHISFNHWMSVSSLPCKKPMVRQWIVYLASHLQKFGK